MPRPDVVPQPRGTPWCGPAAAVAVVRALTGRTFDLEEAKRDLLGTWLQDQTSVEALTEWLARRGTRASWSMVSIGGAYDACRQALRGGAYAIPLVYGDGVDGPWTHFFIAWAVAPDGALMIADSIDRPSRGGHYFPLSERDFEDRWSARVGRFGPLDITPVIIVRRA